VYPENRDAETLYAPGFSVTVVPEDEPKNVPGDRLFPETVMINAEGLFLRPITFMVTGLFLPPTTFIVTSSVARD